jgi:hypothetical protein
LQVRSSDEALHLVSDQVSAQRRPLSLLALELLEFGFSLGHLVL